METARSLRYEITRTVGTAGNAHREHSAGTVRTQAARGVLVPSLALVALAATGAASSGQAISGHVHPTASEAAGNHAVLARAGTARPCKPLMYVTRIIVMPSVFTEPGRLSGPWMYAIPDRLSGPWMYAVPSRLSGPWMYTVTIRKPRTDAVPGRLSGPWMYTVTIKRPEMNRSSDSSRANVACLAGGAST